ncbi:MAG TPA: BsuPI-related putative proteinase inhibitor [Chthonomonadaceae bacterium]|nr:BsuPI-related putative proteinase inhibitor [Chthonomonadaceae bacterium]
MRGKYTLQSACGAAILLMALASGPGGAQTTVPKKAPPPGQPLDTAPKAGVEIVVPVAVSVRTDKKIYRPHEPIKMTITAKNATRDPARLTFPTGQRYDLDIRRGSEPKNPKIWQWSRGRMFTQMVSFVSLPPGKMLVFTETYHPGQEQAPVLTPGAYMITATLASAGHGSHPFGTTRITIRP